MSQKVDGENLQKRMRKYLRNRFYFMIIIVAQSGHQFGCDVTNPRFIVVCSNTLKLSSKPQHSFGGNSTKLSLIKSVPHVQHTYFSLFLICRESSLFLTAQLFRTSAIYSLLGTNIINIQTSPGNKLNANYSVLNKPGTNLLAFSCFLSPIYYYVCSTGKSFS